MPLSIGEKVGAYEILGPLGAGGMGEVYRARDSKLKREVAIKVLPAAFASDPDRMARFQREAQVLASLNHPNIAQIYGIEDCALVMELVPGEPLKGPLPLATTLQYARQIASALEAAHEKGIVHRDLKPGNIMVTPDGVVKVLDFGLAAIAPGAGESTNPANSPTLTMQATQAGIIMGTASYMSPEQAAGKPVDKRADIWSFGVVLWEMLTGQQLFEGETVSHTLAHVLTATVELRKVPASTPPAIREMLRRCLDRNLKTRLRDIGEARIVLENPPTAIPETAAPPSRPWLAWSASAVVFAIAAALAFVHFRESPPPVPVIRTLIAPPDKTLFNMYGNLASVALPELSPDGRRLAFGVRTAQGKTQLWVRSLDSLLAQPLPGTDNAIHPFWSPDSKFIAFFADSKLKKIEASGGPAFSICDVPEGGRGGTWNEEGVILFSPIGVEMRRVAAAGGVSAPISLQGRWPSFLPDGRHFLFLGNSKIQLGLLDSKETKVVVDAISQAVYVLGQILYLRDNTLMAQPFDLKKLVTSGDAVPLAEDVLSVGSVRRGAFSVSRDGLLVYKSGGGQGNQVLAWIDRNGKRVGVVGEPGDLNVPKISPDGKMVAVSVLDPASHTFDTWLFDVTRGIRTRFTFDSPSYSIGTIWAPDGASLAFAVRRNGKNGVYRKAANLSGSEDLLSDQAGNGLLRSWSPDGKLISYSVASNGSESWILPLSGDRKPFRFPEGAVRPTDAQFSPDGRWIAYNSSDSQRPEVYIVPFPGPGGKVQVSTAGGGAPRWRRDGTELFYISLDGQMMAAELAAKGGSMDVGKVRALFGGLPGLGFSAYDVAADGQRFLIVMQTEQTGPEPLTLVQNWAGALRR